MWHHGASGGTGSLWAVSAGEAWPPSHPCFPAHPLAEWLVLAIPAPGTPDRAAMRLTSPRRVPVEWGGCCCCEFIMSLRQEDLPQSRPRSHWLNWREAFKWPPTWNLQWRTHEVRHSMRQAFAVGFQTCLIPGEPGEKVDEECIHLHRWLQTESTPQFYIFRRRHRF